MVHIWVSYTGWWYTYPSEKYEFASRNDDYFQYVGNMFKTTNQIISLVKLIEGSLEVKLPTIWRDEKQSREEAERRERLEERRVEEKE